MVPYDDDLSVENPRQQKRPDKGRAANDIEHLLTTHLADNDMKPGRDGELAHVIFEAL